MQDFIIEPGHRTPSIKFMPDKNIFVIQGTSSPEDVRTMYYPVIEWVNKFIEEVLSGGSKIFNNDNPLKFRFDLSYFNSSSAKFFFDLLSELERLHDANIPVNVEWCYDEGDTDMEEAGVDFSNLLGMKFIFVPKSS